MRTIAKIFSPCKVNYMLAINGVRPDGFHNLLSIVAPTRFGDTIEISEAERDFLTCNLEGVPCDESNLVMKAVALFRQASGLDRHFEFNLIKRVPHGAGLGGGSSNGALALKAINEICGSPLGADKLLELCAKMGSDCPLFLQNKAVVMRGRGELVEDLPDAAAKLISSFKLLVFKPNFSINTGWAYKRMREIASAYIPEAAAEDMFKTFAQNPALETLPLVNNMQIPAFEKFPALEAIIGFVKQKYRVPAIMSGSGSACFAIVNSLDDETLTALKRDIIERLGETCFISEA